MSSQNAAHRRLGHRRLGMPKSLALLLGLGALSAAGAGAEAAPIQRDGQIAQPGEQTADTFAGSRIWSDAGRIYLSEHGRDPRELRLGDTPEARRLRELLQLGGATGPASAARLDRMILAGAGGCGFDWAPPAQSAVPARTAAPEPTSGYGQSGDGKKAARPAGYTPSRSTAKPRTADKE